MSKFIDYFALLLFGFEVPMFIDVFALLFVVFGVPMLVSPPCNLLLPMFAELDVLVSAFSVILRRVQSFDVLLCSL